MSSGRGESFERQYRRAAGQVFARVRAEQGWSLREFGEQADTSHTNLYAIERGEATPGIDVLGRVASCIGLDLPGILLLVIAELSADADGLAGLLRSLNALNVRQRKELLQFVDYLHYRDRDDNPAG